VIAAMPVETWDPRFLTPAQAAGIGEFIARVWPKPNVNGADRTRQLADVARKWQGTASHGPRCFVVREDDRVVAHAAIWPREIESHGRRLTVAGLSRVGADPELRGRGLGELVVRAALTPVDDGEFPFALFQASRRVQKFYEKLGAVLVENPIVNSLADDPTANPFWDEIVMRYPADRDWPAGQIDLFGPGF
jgi:predicted acetyltransferase